nr:hypothetical protein [Tanacetum cinerariifolium]
MENFATVPEDIQKWITAEAEAVHIILMGINNDIYSIVDAFPNAMEMWKAIERLKQGESINVQDLETNLYWEFKMFTSQEGFPAQSIRSSNAVALDSPYLLVLIIGASQSRQHDKSESDSYYLFD